MTKQYRFTVEGTGAGGQSWSTVTDITCEFHDIFHIGMIESFNQLTHGKAVFGTPGVGCAGPYDIHKVTIEQVKQ